MTEIRVEVGCNEVRLVVEAGDLTVGGLGRTWVVRAGDTITIMDLAEAAVGTEHNYRAEIERLKGELATMRGIAWVLNPPRGSTGTTWS